MPRACSIICALHAQPSPSRNAIVDERVRFVPADPFRGSSVWSYSAVYLEME
jgi:hypothetical protein